MALQDPQSSAAKAVRSLATLRPDGLLTVAAINPRLDGAIPVVATFDMTTELPGLRRWISDRDGKVNLHFILNPAKRRMNRKPREDDISEFQYAFIECDPIGTETPTQSIRHHRAAITKHDPPPTAMWNSGNGVVAVWRIDVPVQLKSKSHVLECKSINNGLKLGLGGIALGVDNCQNLDRLLRIPYTANIPDKRKRAKGREIVRAGGFDADRSRAFSIFDFPDTGFDDTKAIAAESIGDPIYVDALEEIATSDRVRQIIQDGRARNQVKLGDDTRSAWRFDAICQLIRDGVSLELILGLLTDERFAISERAIETSNPEAYARNEIARAKAKVTKGIADDFSNDLDETTDPDESKGKDRQIVPTLFVWQSPALLPRREWIYKPTYIRKFIGLTTATGGAGKSSLILAELVAIACGKPLLGVIPIREALSVWYWNGEDPEEELQRRLLATMLHHKVSRSEVEGRLYLDSGRVLPIKLANTVRGDTVIATPLVEQLIEAILDFKIDVLAIDPFVSSHNASENDNVAIERVAKEWARIADVTNCAVQISHHTRKTGGENASIEDARGASALNYAARTRRAINVMTSNEASQAGIDPKHRRSFFRGDNANSSMTPPAESLEWYKFVSVNLGNGPSGDGDHVGVVTTWDFPSNEIDLSDQDGTRARSALFTGGPWRKSSRAGDWAGYPIAEALGLQVDKRTIKQLTQLIEDWIRDGSLQEYQAKDSKRRPRPCVRPSELG